MLSKRQIQNRLANYIAGVESIEDFADWLSRESVSMRADVDPDLFDLVASILNRIQTYFDGNIERYILRRELEPFSGTQIPSEQIVSFVEAYQPRPQPSLIRSQSRGQVEFVTAVC